MIILSKRKYIAVLADNDLLSKFNMLSICQNVRRITYITGGVAIYLSKLFTSNAAATLKGVRATVHDYICSFTPDSDSLYCRVATFTATTEHCLKNGQAGCVDNTGVDNTGVNLPLSIVHP